MEKALIFRRATEVGPAVGDIGFASDLVFSVVLKETHSHNANVSRHPVESGASMVDHIQTSGVELSVEALRDGIESHGGDSVATGAPPDLEQKYSELLELFESRAPLTVVTGIRTYSNMVITNISVARDKNSASVLNVSAKLTEIMIASSVMLEVPVSADMRAKKGPAKDLGKKAAEPVDEPTKKKVGPSFLGIFTGNAKPPGT